MRNKKIILFILIFFMVIGLFLKIKLSRPVESEASANADLTFAVLADIHANEKNFKAAIKDLYNVNPNMDALVLNGDTVDQGLDDQYDDIKKILRKNKKKLPETIIKNIGNHEFYDYDSNDNSKEFAESLLNKYLEFSNNEKVYHDEWIKDYHFISLGSENNNSENINSTSAYISDEQINWLKEKLEENYKKGRPIFVFLHQPLYSNFFGKTGPMVVQSDEIKDILSSYPEAILFTSHTHREHNDNFGDDIPFTTVHTGAVGYTLVEDENSEKGFRQDYSYNNGLYIEVTDNNVIIRGRNIKEHTWNFTKEIKN